VARHQHEIAFRRQCDELLHLGRAHRRRFLDEDVLARLERLLRREQSASAPASATTTASMSGLCEQLGVVATIATFG